MKVDRMASYALLRLASQFPVVGIIGPRQSGKSTLAKMAFPTKKFVSFDDRNIRNIANSNPRDFLLAFPDGVIIDEAQKVPDIFDAIKYDVDNGEYTPGKYILTGSSQFKLRENMSDSLAGRASYMRLLPFTIGELGVVSGGDASVYDLIFKGGYPPLYDKKKSFNTYDWFESYIDTYLSFDVKDQINASNLMQFKTFIQLCATYSGQVFSMDSMARKLGLSAPTIKKWLSVLESSFIISFLEPDTNNIGKSLVKTAKMYFTDTGLLCHLLRLQSKEDLLLSPYKGAVVETFAVSEMLKVRQNKARKGNLTYYRDWNGLEVDTIADWRHTFAIEIKSSSDADSGLSSNIHKYIDSRTDVKCRGTVLYLGDLTCTVNNVDYVSWKDWDSYIDDCENK